MKHNNPAGKSAFTSIVSGFVNTVNHIRKLDRSHFDTCFIHHSLVTNCDLAEYWLRAFVLLCLTLTLSQKQIMLISTYCL